MKFVNRQPTSFSNQSNDKKEGAKGENNNFFDKECCYSLKLVSLKGNPFCFLLLP